MIKKLMDKLGYISKNDCFKMMNIDGKGYLESTKSSGCSTIPMLIAWHLFEAVIELLENNNEQFKEENRPYIHLRNQGVIDPPTAFGLFMTYIVSHPDEHHLSLFNLAIRCVKASEINSSEK
ncbi:TPA: hypothetical protein ACK8Z3_000745 [Legionella pneumophila]|uniref:Uncharacterized protein n=1 Tax=Legionella pneumophila subsp. pneumophila TaxID=91891 RepID=A0A3A6VM89_LEGPN|nr:hypothetical protein [Legionella pneumophila]ERH41946.1 hypothetical protein N750_15475 [Legionella pneumophila str. Leg01/53]ERH45181.1 hypothetical protein N751_00785 [Legionella pneumophila str. Leg01/11]ERI48889.1 hypothetical protein N749_07755 [Legionella pneumophila str. Leg01/20]ANN96138.1 hypothetical protein A9P84_10680 [Legionella pneumophila]ERB42279.1 hypothetical protein N748_04715 [Legionella pneumophila str. 121004]